MKAKLAAVEAYRRGNIECARLVIADPRTVPGSLVWRWATAVLAGPATERPTRKTPGPLFEGEVCSDGRH